MEVIWKYLGELKLGADRNDGFENPIGLHGT